MSGSGGAWKVAYADFVTAMMAFFMVMWLTAQSPEVKEAVAEHFREPDDFGFSDIIGVHEHGRDRERKPPRHPDEEKLPAARKPRVLTIREGNRPATAGIVPFAEASAEITPTGEQFLQDLVTQLKGKPQKVEVRGHASRRPLPPESEFKSAWELSYARSLAVLRFLEKQGIEASRIRISQAAANEPLATQAEKSAVAQNDRAEVYLLSEY